MMRVPTSTFLRSSRFAVLIFITCGSIAACNGETPTELNPELRPQMNGVGLTSGNRSGGDTNTPPPDGTDPTVPPSQTPPTGG